MTRHRFELEVPGPPKGKGRARFGNGRTYTPRDTELAELAIQFEHDTAGAPRLPDGPIGVRIELVAFRPASHYRKNGELTAAGLRRPWPDNRKPDVDNAAKLVLDALNGRGWRDDVQVVWLEVTRRWATGDPDDTARTIVVAVSLLPEGPAS